MKRIATFLLAVAAVLPSMAQLGGDGFYRVQNYDSKRYSTIVDNKAEKGNLTSTSNVDLYAINTIEGFDNIISDPGSIIYIEKNESNGYILEGQGMNSYSLTDFYLQVNKRDDYYIASARYQGVEKRLFEAYNSSFDFYYFTSASKDEKGNTRSNKWSIIPVTEADGQYFAIKPEIEVGGKYYTTLYASFACKLSAGMKAYYVKQTNTEAAEIAEIEGDTTPAGTPVIIECSSKNPAENKVTPLKASSASNLPNLLKGVYFCNVIKWADDGQEEPTHKNWNTTNYDSKTMRVLGVVNGKLAFVTAENLKYLPANKAYLPAPDNAVESIQLVDAATFAAWVVKEPEIPEPVDGVATISTDNGAGSIYTLTGIKMRKGQGINDLPAGIYIVNGKKVIVR